MSSDNKKDLTRIEDLGEFIHELSSEDEESSFSEDVPDHPQDTDASFGDSSEFSGPSFEENSEPSSFESSEFTSVDSFENSEFTSSEDPFSGGDFSSSGFEENTTFAEETSATFGAEGGPFEETQDFGSSFETTKEEKKDEEQPWSSESPFVDIASGPAFLEEEKEGSEATEKETDALSLSETFIPEEPSVSYGPPKEFKTPENFEDIKKFSESSSFTGMATEGNPSFSVLVKNVRYIEDINDILALLKEFNLLVDSEEQTKARLMRGTLLIPRISEYAAIYVAHKLRRFDVDLLIGPSDEIHPPKHQETPETGIVSKHNLYQNQSHHFHFDDPKLELSQIIVAATPTLEGYQVIRYMGVASEHKMLDSHLVEDENSSEIPPHYHELAQKLKAHALKNNSNAVVGLNYQLTPLPSELGIGGHKYRLTCTGNLVWVNKL